MTCIANAHATEDAALSKPESKSELRAHIAFGPEYSSYNHEVNRLINDPIGGSVEIGFGGKTTRLQLRAVGTTKDARRTQSLSGDTIFQGNSLNIVRWAIALSHQTYLTQKVYVGFLYGLEWGTLGRPKNEEDRQPEISVPITSGALIGLYAGQNFFSIPLLDMDLGYRVEYTYSSMDFRVYNPNLGYGRHGLAFKVYFGD